MHRYARWTLAALVVLGACGGSDPSPGRQLAELDIEGLVSAGDERGFEELLSSAANECEMSPEDLARVLKEVRSQIVDAGEDFKVYDALASFDRYGKAEPDCETALRIRALLVIA